MPHIHGPLNTHFKFQERVIEPLFSLEQIIKIIKDLDGFKLEILLNETLWFFDIPQFKFPSFPKRNYRNLKRGQIHRLKNA